MSSRKSFVRTAGTLVILFTMTNVTFAEEQITAPPSLGSKSATVTQSTYPPNLIPDVDMQSPVDQPVMTKDSIQPLVEQPSTATSSTTASTVQPDVTTETVPQQAYAKDVALVPPAPQRSSVQAVSASLLPPVTKAESYVDPTTLTPPDNLVLQSNDVNTTSTTTNTDSGITDTPTTIPTTATNTATDTSTPTTTLPVTAPSPSSVKVVTVTQAPAKTTGGKSVTTAKKPLPVINNASVKGPGIITTSLVKYTTKVGDTLYFLAQDFITTIKSIKFLNNLKSDNLNAGQKLQISSNRPANSSYKTKLDPYTVKGGDTLTIIAKKYGTTAASIKTTNGLVTNALYIGQVLQVPYVSNLVANGSFNVKYKIARGDNLKLIAQNFKTTVVAIKALNGLKSDALFAGEYLQIPTTTDVANALLVDVPTQNYRVVNGDSLTRLAKESDCTVAVLKLLNNLTSDALFTGKILKVPAGSNLPVTEGIDLERAALSSRYEATRSEELLLARLIYAEARGEEYEGQVAVGAVVLNRTTSPDFPKTIGEVIYQQYEFSAVLDGQINLTPDAKAMKAARAALNGEDPSGGALFYWNPVKAPNNKFLNAKEIIKRIGAHVFAK